MTRFIALDTADYLMLSTSAVTITSTPQRLQIVLSLATLALDRTSWEHMSDSVWDAWEAGLVEMIDQIQDY